MVEHDDIRMLICAYADGEASADEKARAEAHLKECTSCQQYYKEIKNIASSLKLIPDESLSPDLEQQIHAKLSQVPNKEKPMKNRLLTVGVGSSVLTVVLIMFVGMHLYSQRALQGRVRDASQYLVSATGSAHSVPNQPAASAGSKESKQPMLLAQLKDAISSVGDKLNSRGVQGRLRSASDDIGDQFSPGNTSVAKSAKVAEKVALNQPATAQYEPYYLQSNYGVRRDATEAPVAMDEARARAAGGFQSSSYGGVSGVIDMKQEFWGKSSVAESNLIACGGPSCIPPMPYPEPEQPRYFYPQPAPSDTEQYDRITENNFLEAKSNPLSTFSIDVDTASYANMRRFLNGGQLPPADAVRIEELINYFHYDYPQPSGEEPFSITTEVSKCPWNPKHELVMIGLQGKKMDIDNLPPGNLVFLIDVSGSMDEPNKLPLLKSSFKLLVNQLRNNDRVAIVTYAGAAGLALPSTPGSDKQRILAAIDSLYAGGSTAGGEGIKLAYRIAQENLNREGNNRVILATDGDFNVGVTNDDELVRLIEEKRDQGIALSVLGFGTGNYKDSKMEKLADHGNGNYAYIDGILEGQKVFVNQLGGTLLTIAKDVKIQIEFNPGKVKAYRLIGYENRALAKEDFNDDTKDAGELGAGHTVTALYEVVDAASDETFAGVDALKYQQVPEAPQAKIVDSDELMTVKLRYKKPNEDKSQLLSQAISSKEVSPEPRSDNFKFASAVAEFGLLVRDSHYKGNASFENVLSRARAARGGDEQGYRAEFIRLAETAKLLKTQNNPVPPVRYQE